mgnify:CR=1 FL=1|tara:strand:- start:171 stop:437 length:267 start_codon:yes stop_codon:yes gene_type:complete
MKHILAIAIGILLLSSDASEAKAVVGPEQILATGLIINKFIPKDDDGGMKEAEYHVIFKSRIYKCSVYFYNWRVGVECFDSDAYVPIK